MILPIFFINLASRPDRRAFMEEQFAQLGLSAQRIEAVSPADIAAEDIERFCDNTQPVYLRPNQLACSMSHEKVWRTMLDQGHERAVVMEDDALLSRLLPAFLGDIGSAQFDVLRFETPSRKVRVLPAVQSVGPDIALRPFRSSLAGRSGYVIGANAARRFLAHPAFRVRAGDRIVNGVLAEPDLRLVRYITDPGLCVQMGNTGAEKRAKGVGWSDLNATRTPNLFAQRHPVQYFLHRSRREVMTALGSAADHLAYLPRGIRKQSIPFKAD